MLKTDWVLLQLLGGVSEDFFGEVHDIMDYLQIGAGKEETTEMIAKRYGDLFSRYTPQELDEYLGILKDDKKIPKTFYPLWEEFHYVPLPKLEKAISIYLDAQTRI